MRSEYEKGNDIQLISLEKIYTFQHGKIKYDIRKVSNISEELDIIFTVDSTLR